MIMPFSKTNENHSEEYWSRHFNSYLKPLIEKVEGIQASRSEPLRGDISNQIITNLINSEIIVADLTDHNPNVMWELGVRQSYKHCAITIAEMGTQIPFHLSHKGILFYHGDHLNNESFEERFLESLKNCLLHPDEPDSPVLEAMGGRGTLYSIIHENENKRRIAALKQELQKNRNIYGGMIDNCQENAAIRSQKIEGETKKMGSSQLRTHASEFLLTNRYLDLPEQFYNLLLRYYGALTAINITMANWIGMEHEERLEEWLISDKEKMGAIFSEYDDYLKTL